MSCCICHPSTPEQVFRVRSGCQVSVCSSVLSRHNTDWESWTLRPLRRVTALGSWTDRVIALREISVTSQCCSSILFRRQQENPSSKHEGMSTQRHEEKRAPGRGRERERESESPLAPLFICCFLPPGPAPCKLGLGRSVVLPEVLILIHLPLFNFQGLFPSLSFGLLFPILTT